MGSLCRPAPRRLDLLLARGTALSHRSRVACCSGTHTPAGTRRVQGAAQRTRGGAERGLPISCFLNTVNDNLDGIVVETSGLALPEPLIDALQWPAIRTRIRVNGVVAVVDGEALAAGSVVADPAALEAQRVADPSLDHVSAIEDLFAEQLEAADLVLISRADSLDEASLRDLEARLLPDLRPGAAVMAMERGAVSPELVLGLERQLANGDSHSAHDHDHHHDHEHDHDHSHVAIESLALQLSGAFDRLALEQQLNQLLQNRGLIRLKGRLWLKGKARPLQIQAVGPRLECWFESGAPEPADHRPTPPAGLELVVLGFQLDQAAIESTLLKATGAV